MINLDMSNSSFNVLQTTVNLELCKIDHWLRANKLSLDYNKTNFMLHIFSPVQKSTYETKRKNCALLLRSKLKVTKFEDYQNLAQM